ncbi:(deoxy)nucleoside triphosphate pyrophosphohydrolase [Bifidobacterium pullorum subsp. saeculare]|uniref:8-oxo-dGTP diphosphatase n=1 Tax=Bifidobacterium pullorum subsp. saeculare TaxID=78257 RepID=A0A938WXF2_9BIFI|nr:(deoxy)nucleoside triphosphate pyrophosphohydrolase [Bifidobacterium pullorum]MBM6700059.1 (deoxy)nucleoside triphosphate pyrophosphohydrolase [Bifidobacterium pullorum subsp. saeculare]
MSTGTAPTPTRKIITVVGAAIVKDGKVLCAQRGEGKSLAGFWEFPGGKVEPHETPREALHREIEEELRCDIEVADEVCTSSYDYDFGTVVLTTFIGHLHSGAPRLTEHQAIRWLAPAEMPTLDWAPADHEAVRMIAAMAFPSAADAA